MPFELFTRIRNVLSSQAQEDTLPPDRRQPPVQERKNAVAWVENGAVKVSGPQPGGHYAAVLADEGICMRVNDKACRSAAVREGDAVEAWPALPCEDVAPDIEITVQEDGLSGTATVATGNRVERWLAGADPVERLLLSAESAVRPLRPTEEGVHEALKQAGVSHGIDPEAIAHMVATAGEAGEASAVVARGTFPSDGTPLHAAFDASLSQDEAGQFVVQTGRRVAQLHEARRGLPGCKVTGEPVPPAPVADRHLVLGDGLRRSGDTLYAETDGRVVHRLTGNELTLDVVPLHLFPGGLSGTTVHEGRGEMLVLGDVERSEIETAGRLDVLGAASESRIRAQDVRVMQSIARSVAQAGCDLIGLPVYWELKNIALFLAALCEAYCKVAESDQARRLNLKKYGFHPLVHVLSQRQFSSIRDDLEACERFGLGLPTDLWAQLGALLGGDSAHADLEHVRRLSQVIGDIVDALEALTAQDVTLFARSAVNSRLASGGHVHLDRGAEETDIGALGWILSEGTVRGGRMWSRKGVVVATLGSAMAMDTEIELAAGDVVARHIYSGVRVCIDGHRLRVENPVGPCRIFVGADRLEIKYTDFETVFEERSALLHVGSPLPPQAAPDPDQAP